MSDIKFSGNLVRQRSTWDCAVACIASAANISYEKAILTLQGEFRDGYIPHEVFRAMQTLFNKVEMFSYNRYNGPLNSSIIQISDNTNRMPFHYVWICPDGFLNCPAGTFTSWGDVHVFGHIIKYDQNSKK